MFGTDIEIIRAISLLKDKGVIPKTYDHVNEILVPVKKEKSVNGK